MSKPSPLNHTTDPDVKSFDTWFDADGVDLYPTVVRADHDPSERNAAQVIREKYPRLVTRRSLVALGLGSIAAVGAVAVPLTTEGSYYPGTLVGGLDISEKSHDQALTALQNYFADFENTAADFFFEEQSWNASLSQLGFAIDYDATLENAYTHGRGDGVVDRYAGLLVSTSRRDYPVIFKRNDEKLHTFLEEIGTQILGAARDARLYLDGDTVGLLPSADGQKLDVERAAKDTARVVQRAERGKVQLRANPVESQITTEDLEPYKEQSQTLISKPITLHSGEDRWTVGVDMLVGALVIPKEGTLQAASLDIDKLAEGVQMVADDLYVSPANATFGWDGGLVVLENDQLGTEVDVQELATEIAKAAASATDRTVQITLKDVPAPARADNVDELGIVDQISEGTSSFEGSSEERAANIRVSADHLTHTLVPPGGEFSFNGAVGEISVDNGFVEGKIILGGWIESDIGGGACQASTTVYRSALYAGFEISEWHAHTYRLQMYELLGEPPGIDAAIFQPNDDYSQPLDMKFVNPTETWLLVEMTAGDDNIARCTIYGTPNDWETDVEVPYISDPIKPDPPQEKESDKLRRGDRQRVQVATPGYNVTMTRSTTLDGERVRDDEEFTSYFQPQREQWLIGPGTKRKFPEDNDDSSD